MNLRPYQEELVVKALAMLRKNKKCLIQLPTGAGKTVIYAEIIRRLKLHTLVLCHRREILEQARRAVGLTAEVVSVAVREPSRGYDLIVMDEAHHYTDKGKQWRKFLDVNPGVMVLGLSATPMRLSKKERLVAQGGLFEGCMLSGPSIPELVADGWLAPMSYYVWAGSATIDAALDHAPMVGGEFTAQAMDTALNAASGIEHIASVGVAMIKDKCRELGIPVRCAVFCASVDNAAKVSRATGWPMLCTLTLDAFGREVPLPVSERNDIVRKLRAGVIDGVVSVDMISEGFDCPALTCALALRPTASPIVYMQQAGRLMRLDPSRDRTLMLDMVGNYNRMGFAPGGKTDWIEMDARVAKLKGRPGLADDEQFITTLKTEMARVGLDYLACKHTSDKLNGSDTELAQWCDPKGMAQIYRECAVGDAERVDALDDNQLAGFTDRAAAFVPRYHELERQAEELQAETTIGLLKAQYAELHRAWTRALRVDASQPWDVIKATSSTLLEHKPGYTYYIERDGAPVVSALAGCLAQIDDAFPGAYRDKLVDRAMKLLDLGVRGYNKRQDSMSQYAHGYIDTSRHLKNYFSAAA
jgi:superfamily II DNA or RNA helicase